MISHGVCLHPTFFTYLVWLSLGASMWLQMALIRSYWSWDSQPTKALGVAASTVPCPRHKARCSASQPVGKASKAVLSVPVSSGVTRQSHGPCGGVFLTLIWLPATRRAQGEPRDTAHTHREDASGCRPWQLTTKHRVWRLPEGHSRFSCLSPVCVWLSTWVCSAAVNTADCRLVFLQSVNPHTMFPKAKISSCYLKPPFIPAE